MINYLTKLNLIYVAILAFVFYSAVNFIYFPLNLVFPDEHRFMANAFSFAKDFSYRNGTSAWEMPLVSSIYGLFAIIFDTKVSLIISVRVFQSLLLLIQAFLLYRISLMIFKDIETAKITFITVAFYPFFAFYQGLLVSETIFITLLVSSFYFLYFWYEKGFKFDKYFLLTNIFFVLAVYSKATLIFLSPFLMATFVFLIQKDFKKTLLVLLSSLLLFILMMSPWWIRNYQIFDEFVPFSTSSGANLYLGNNPANKTGGAGWDIDIEPKVVKKIASIENELKRNKSYTKQGINYIKENPKRFMELMWLKFKRYWNVFPNTKIYVTPAMKWITFISFAPILLFALISIFRYRSKWRELSPIYILILFFTLLHIIVIASLRYRLPLEPFLIVLAAPIITEILTKLKFNQ